MPDITMCLGEDCPKRNHCYRFKAAPDEYQSYFSHPPYDSKNKFCEYYWYIEKDMDPYMDRELMLKPGDKGYSPNR